MFQEMLQHIDTPFDQCIDILKKNMKLDPGFKAFYEWAKEHNVPIVILSSGMIPIIRALIEVMLGEETDNLTIVANEVEGRNGKDINDVGGWQIRYRDDRYYNLQSPLVNKMADASIAPSVTTSPLRSSHTLRSRGASVPLFCMPEMESPTCLLHVRPIFSLLRRARVSALQNNRIAACSQY